MNVPTNSAPIFSDLVGTVSAGAAACNIAALLVASTRPCERAAWRARLSSCSAGPPIFAAFTAVLVRARMHSFRRIREEPVELFSVVIARDFPCERARFPEEFRSSRVVDVGNENASTRQARKLEPSLCGQLSVRVHEGTRQRRGWRGCPVAFCDKSCVHDAVNMLPLERMMRDMAVAPRRCALSTHGRQCSRDWETTRGRDIDSREYHRI